MEDAQLLMNGHVRMAIDNLALAGNLVFDVDEASLVPGQNMDIFPGKIFRRQSGVTGTAINGLKGFQYCTRKFTNVYASKTTCR